MCDTCGCNVTPGNEHLVAAGGHLAKTSTGHESVEVLKSLLDANDHQAGHNRDATVCKLLAPLRNRTSPVTTSPSPSAVTAP